MARDVLGGQRRDDQLPVPGEPDLARPAAPGELRRQVRQRRVQLVIRQGQGVSRRHGLAGHVAELQPLRLPLLRGEQERGRVGVNAQSAWCSTLWVRPEHDGGVPAPGQARGAQTPRWHGARAPTRTPGNR